MMNYMICLNDSNFSIVYETSSVRETITKIHELTSLPMKEIMVEMKEAITHPRCAHFCRYNLTTGKKVFDYIVDFE